MKAPEIIETERLFLRPPSSTDAEEIFTRYAADPEVTKYISFRAHVSLDDTYEFLKFSEKEWEQKPAGPYLIRLRTNNLLIGSTGLSFETPYRAMTGYIFAKDSWGKGYATESLNAMVETGKSTGLQRLYALCHTGNERSWKVLEKCGFIREATLRRYAEFPNLSPGVAADVFCYALIF